jgi:hypothetical protein
MILLNDQGLVQAVAESQEEAWEVIKALAEEYRLRRSDREREAVSFGVDHGIHPDEIFSLFKVAREAREAAVFSVPDAQPSVEQRAHAKGLKIRRVPGLTNAKPGGIDAIMSGLKATKVLPGPKEGFVGKIEKPKEIVIVPTGGLVASTGGVLYGMIDAMNLRHAVIGNIGGKYRIMEWVPSRIDRSVLVPEFQTEADFGKRYREHVVTPEGAGMKAELWLLSKKCAKFDTITFEPGGPPTVITKTDGITTTAINTWRGWGIKPAPRRWPLLRGHIEKVLCNGDARVANYTFDWLAHGYQKPWEKNGTALVWQGEEGLGKGLLGNAVRRSYGSHGLYM